MLAGGLGNIRHEHIEKGAVKEGDKLVVLGGPAMLIGLAVEERLVQLTADLVKRIWISPACNGTNPEMERRCQEVIDRCWALGEKNPIVFIHDVGAGGLSNAMPELVNDAAKGRFDLRKIPNDEPGMSPLKFGVTSLRSAMCWRFHLERINVFFGDL